MGLWLNFGPTRKIFLRKFVNLSFVSIFFGHQCWLYKPTAKMLVTFVLGNKNCKRAWMFPLKTLPTTVCIDISFEIFDVPWQSIIFYSSPSFWRFLIHLQIHTSLFVCYIICKIQISALVTCISCCHDVAWFFKFFFYSFSISGCWDRVQGSPWRINNRSTLQNYNRRHKVRLPPYSFLIKCPFHRKNKSV